jgi:hypothetical protein
MTETEIREIVRITLEELTAKSIVSYQDILKVMDKQLYSYFETTDLFTNDITVRICSILNSTTDPYIHIIYYQYRDHKTIEWIAEHLHKDVSTIKRNKKRIITKMYEELYK